MRHLPERQGRIAEWNDERGFGFIDDPDARGRVFVHIKAFGGGAGRPVAGDRVAYILGEGRDGRAAAPRARILGIRRASAVEQQSGDAPTRTVVRIVAALMLATAVVCCAVTGRGPLWLPVLYLIGGALSFAAYAIDKGAATRGEWRISEGMLHLIDAVFGIAGGLLAQGLLRHKSSKQASRRRRPCSTPCTWQDCWRCSAACYRSGPVSSAGPPTRPSRRDHRLRAPC